MSYRKLVINGNRFLYKVGTSFVEIRNEEFNRIETISSWDLKGITESEFKSARNKVSSYVSIVGSGNYNADHPGAPTKKDRDNASVYPSDVKRYIEENFLVAKES